MIELEEDETVYFRVRGKNYSHISNYLYSVDDKPNVAIIHKHHYVYKCINRQYHYGECSCGKTVKETHTFVKRLNRKYCRKCNANYRPFKSGVDTKDYIVPQTLILYEAEEENEIC